MPHPEIATLKALDLDGVPAYFGALDVGGRTNCVVALNRIATDPLELTGLQLPSGVQPAMAFSIDFRQRGPSMSSDPHRRLSQMLTAALHSPNFAVRLLHQSPAPERAEVVRRWSQSALPAAGAPARPGLRKCSPRPATQSQDMAVQLAAFARSVRRVGPESA